MKKVFEYEIKKINDDFYAVKITEGSNHVRLYANSFYGSWEYCTFSEGLIDCVEFQKDSNNKKLYKKVGRGKVKNTAKEQIKYLLGAGVDLIEFELENLIKENKLNGIKECEF